jgi:two-component system response regulator NreC
MLTSEWPRTSSHPAAPSVFELLRGSASAFRPVRTLRHAAGNTKATSPICCAHSGVFVRHGSCAYSDESRRPRPTPARKWASPWPNAVTVPVMAEPQASSAGSHGPSADEAASIRIVLADDHAVVRRGLRLLLDGEAGFEVVAEAGDVDGARRYVRGHHPAVLVLDLNMPGGSSLDAIPEIRSESPETQIVVLTMKDAPEFARQALAGGAIGYVLKEAADSELLEAVRRAAAGQAYLTPSLGARVAAEPSGPPDDLSERELGVLRLIALGHTNTEIAEQLYLSVRTVETHRAHLQQTLQLNSRAELVRYALERGLVDLG